MTEPVLRILTELNRMTKRSAADLSRIKLLVLDVDGVLTDGAIIINDDGSESKCFNSLDGHGIRMWKRAGLKIAFLSGRSSNPTKHRACQLEVDYCLQDCHDKLSALDSLAAQSGVVPQDMACMGDDLPDLPVMKAVQFSAAPANAVEQVKQSADYVTVKAGGCGAVREVIEYLLKKTGKWSQVVERYL